METINPLFIIKAAGTGLVIKINQFKPIHLNNKNGIIYRYRNDWLSG